MKEMKGSYRTRIRTITALVALLLFTNLHVPNSISNYFSPIDIVIDSPENRLFVAGETAHEVRSYAISDQGAYTSYFTELPPKALKVAGENLLVACSYSKGELVILDRETLQHQFTIQVGHGACDVEISPDLARAYVANQFSNDISVVNLHKNLETNRIPVLRQPRQVTISADGNFLFVANFLPAGRADVDTVTSEITIIDLQTEKPLKHVSLANGSNALRGMCLSADGAYVLVTHNLGRFQVPTTQLEQGWMNTSALSVIDAQNLSFIATVLLDESGFGAAGSWGIDCDSESIYVAHSGTHDISKINYAAFDQKLKTHPDKKSLAYDLTFLSGIRERFNIEGNGPRAIKSSGNWLITGNYYSDNLSIVQFGDAGDAEINDIPLNDQSDIDITRLGEIYFHDAMLCFQSWQSCTGCHPDNARTDGLNWDLLNDGMGNPKNCKSLLMSHVTPPSMVTGVRPRAEVAVRAGFESIQFMQVDEKVASAVDSYLKSLEAIPSPYLVEDELSATATMGKVIFEELECQECHPAPYFTDQKLHTMGTQGEYDHQNSWDTPTLIEVWRTGPYLHDGRCASLVDVFTREKHGIETELSEDRAEQLVAYVLSL